MNSNLLETVIQSAYDSGYKAGYDKAAKDAKLDPTTEIFKKPDSIQKLWLTPKDLAEEFDSALSTQAKMRMEKRIPYHKIGRYVRYKRVDINQWLDAAKIV